MTAWFTSETLHTQSSGDQYKISSIEIGFLSVEQRSQKVQEWHWRNGFESVQGTSEPSSHYGSQRHAQFEQCEISLYEDGNRINDSGQRYVELLVESSVSRYLSQQNYRHFRSSSAANIPTAQFDNTESHRTMHCNELVFIFCYLRWRHGFEKFRNIPVFRPARCSWRCAVEPYWNEHQF
jgi:hypothetical protein